MSYPREKTVIVLLNEYRIKSRGKSKIRVTSWISDDLEHTVAVIRSLHETFVQRKDS
ncbi:MAG: hypothetical protein GTN80_07490 [Nitrososphaeria archaeon]|nr:hypothetical protein [Nitrososphaeria archaeon]NIQ33468.1 hypothetical protein [Nitrososphaeria archaeon]